MVKKPLLNVWVTRIRAILRSSCCSKIRQQKQQTSASTRLILLFSPIRTITVGSRITLDLLTSVLLSEENKKTERSRASQNHHLIISYYRR
ncbi:hypothetical protein XSR1_20123 [Xenorhabdus szentirmaii DSM 16338]|uniref:Uncharacterized protein n=1 Tax=Xenorhabdus szentirmaii DSM 16338 TaxID=1427518 RepID=W1IV25_9GAMM|nr:hypothetical protein XSR1_20123 [Xenorhabdus szentirmaii DSM 16338]